MKEAKKEGKKRKTTKKGMNERQMFNGENKNFSL